MLKSILLPILTKITPMQKSKYSIICIIFFFSLYSFSQEKATDSLTYNFSSYVKGADKTKDNTYIRKVNIYKSDISDQIIKYTFLCMDFKFEGPNNVSYIRRVAYVFDEITVLVNPSGKIIDVIKPEDMDTRWQETKEKILLSYSGSAITKYLEQVEETINNKQKLTDFLQSDAMYGLLLKGLSQINNPDQLSKIKFNKKEDLKTITAKSLSKDDKEQFVIKKNTLIKATKASESVSYEIDLLPYQE